MLAKILKLTFWLTTLAVTIAFFTYFDELKIKYNTYLSPPLQFTIADTTLSSGIDFKIANFSIHPSLKKIEPWVVNISASVAVSDFNNDGYQDIFFNNAKRGTRHHLYKNNGQGGFEEVSSMTKINEIKNQYPITGSFFFDCDDDGFQDLFLLSYCPIVLKNHKGQFFSDITQQSGITCSHQSLHARNLVDYNFDGKKDILLAGYFDINYLKKPDRDQFMPENSLDTKNKADIFIYKNEGQCRFKKVPNPAGIDNQGWSLALGVYDFNDDNKDDIWVAKDFGNDQLYIGSEKGFINESQKIFTDTTSRNGMNSEISDFNNDGLADVYVSHIMQKDERIAGNLLWSYQKDHQFEDIGREQGVDKCGWSWGGKFIDFNNDGLLDLAVANGFISANPKKNKYWYQLSVLNSGPRGSMANYKNWPDLTDQTIAGYQQNCLFLNNGEQFFNVTSQTSLKDDLYDGRGVAVIDYLNNGSQALVFANQNGPAKLYTITQKNNHNWIGFELTNSNHSLAIGAKVTLTLKNEKKLYRQLQPLNGFSSQSDPRIHFGIGLQTVKEALITWPSGSSKTLDAKDLTINQYLKIQEPG